MSAIKTTLDQKEQTHASTMQDENVVQQAHTSLSRTDHSRVNSATTPSSATSDASIFSPDGVSTQSSLPFISQDTQHEDSSSLATPTSASIDPNSICPFSASRKLKVLHFGRIEYIKPNYHNDKYLYPIGYKVEREFISYKDATLNEGRVLYTAEILDGGIEPIFQVTPTDDPQNPARGNSPTGAWMVIMNRIKDSGVCKGRKHYTISGPEQYGLADKKVKEMIERLPNANLCAKYQTQGDGSATPRRSKSEVDTSAIVDTNGGTRPRKAKSISRSNQNMKTLPVDTSLLSNIAIQNSNGETGDNSLDGNSNQSSEEKKKIEPPKYFGLKPENVLPSVPVNQYRLLDKLLPIYEGDTTYTSYFNSFKATDIPTTVNFATVLKSMWEIFYSFYFIDVLRPALHFIDFSFEELEQALLNPENNKGFLADLHMKLIIGPLVDETLYFSYLDEKTWHETLLQTLNDPFFTENYWKENPLQNQSYEKLTPITRVYILKSLLDFKFDFPGPTAQYILSLPESVLRVSPIGLDKDKNLYYYLDGILFRETMPDVSIVDKKELMEQEKFAELESPSRWESVTDGYTALEQFSQGLSKAAASRDAKLGKVIVSTLLPSLHELYLKRAKDSNLYIDELSDEEAVLLYEKEKKQLIDSRRKERELYFSQRIQSSLQILTQGPSSSSSQQQTSSQSNPTTSTPSRPPVVITLKLNAKQQSLVSNDKKRKTMNSQQDTSTAATPSLDFDDEEEFTQNSSEEEEDFDMEPASQRRRVDSSSELSEESDE